MKETVYQLESLINEGLEYISQSSEAELTQKPSPKKWSKKEIMDILLTLE